MTTVMKMLNFKVFLLAISLVLAGTSHAQEQLSNVQSSVQETTSENEVLENEISKKMSELEQSAKESKAIKSVIGEKQVVATSAATAEVASDVKTAESEIPVFANTGEKKAEPIQSESLGRILLTFGFLIVFLLGGIALIKKYSANQSKKSVHTQIKVVTSHSLGPKKSLTIVKVAGDHLLLGVTDHSIHLVKQLHVLDEDYSQDRQVFEDDLLEQKTKVTQSFPITSLMKQEQSASKAIAKALPKKTAPRMPEMEEDSDNEIFAFQGIRDFVTRSRDAKR